MEHPGLGHGRSRYVAYRCRCATCRDANTAYQRHRWRSIHRPDGEHRAALVDAHETRVRLIQMLQHGETLAAIARSTATPRSTLSDIVHGRTRRTRRAVHDAVVNAYRSHVSRRASSKPRTSVPRRLSSGPC